MNFLLLYLFNNIKYYINFFYSKIILLLQLKNSNICKIKLNKFKMMLKPAKLYFINLSVIINLILLL